MKLFVRNRGDTDMRDDQDDLEAVGFQFHFQIADGPGRKACSVRVEATNFHAANAAFRDNWPTIELMARQTLASLAEGEEIRLSLAPP